MSGRDDVILQLCDCIGQVSFINDPLLFLLRNFIRIYRAISNEEFTRVSSVISLFTAVRSR